MSEDAQDDNVVELGAHDKMTIKEALEFCLREAETYEDIVIIATEKDTDDIIIRSSGMARMNAAWLADKLRMWAHGLL